MSGGKRNEENLKGEEAAVHTGPPLVCPTVCRNNAIAF